MLQIFLKKEKRLNYYIATSTEVFNSVIHTTHTQTPTPTHKHPHPYTDTHTHTLTDHPPMHMK